MGPSVALKPNGRDGSYSSVNLGVPDTGSLSPDEGLLYMHLVPPYFSLCTCL